MFVKFFYFIIKKDFFQAFIYIYIYLSHFRDILILVYINLDNAFQCYYVDFSREINASKSRVANDYCEITPLNERMHQFYLIKFASHFLVSDTLDAIR